MSSYLEGAENNNRGDTPCKVIGEEVLATRSGDSLAELLRNFLSEVTWGLVPDSSQKAVRRTISAYWQEIAKSNPTGKIPQLQIDNKDPQQPLVPDWRGDELVIYAPGGDDYSCANENWRGFVLHGEPIAKGVVRITTLRINP